MTQTTNENNQHTKPFTPSQTPFTIGWIIRITILLAVLIAGVMFFGAKEPYPMIMGLAFGTIFSILNFRLLHLTIAKSMDMTPNQAKSYVTSRYIIRYVLAAAVLYVAITNESINVLGAVIGLLVIKGVIFGINFYDAMKKGLNKG